MSERLQKIISQAGVASRRAAEKMILAGRVAVDGHTVTELGQQYDAAAHTITVDGKPMTSAETHRYYLLNKPRGYISTVHDERGRRTVLDLLPEVRERIYPVGRLDGATEGLLLLTNDGELMNGLLHPRYQIDKVYVAQLRDDLSESELQQLATGIELEDGRTAPARARLLPDRGHGSRVELTIHEGRNRQVRRMFAALGHEVKSLRRVKFAGLTLQGVARGQHRQLSQTEVERLYQLAGLEHGQKKR